MITTQMFTLSQFVSSIIKVSIVGIFSLLFFQATNAQTPAIADTQSRTLPVRPKLKAIVNTQYTAHTELFAEFRPLIQNVAARFTAHLTQIAETFKPYTDAEVTLMLTIGEKVVWQETITKPIAAGIYRFPVKSESTGTGKVTITLKMPSYSEQFFVENVTVYADEAAALNNQSSTTPENTIGEITYYKEKSWLENFATAPVTIVKNALLVPQTAVFTENEISYVYVQKDPEHFRKQVVKTEKKKNGEIKIKEGLKPNDRIVTLGVDKIK